MQVERAGTRHMGQVSAAASAESGGCCTPRRCPSRRVWGAERRPHWLQLGLLHLLRLLRLCRQQQLLLLL